MDLLDNLSQLPEWDDEKFDNNNEDGEAWKNTELRNAAKALYNKWREVMAGLYGLLAHAEKNDDFSAEKFEEQKNMLIGDALQIAVKVRTSDSIGMYVLLMENASIVRKNAISIQTQISALRLMGAIDEDYSDAVKADIEQFRLLFIDWIQTFKKDEFEDEWEFFV